MRLLYTILAAVAIILESGVSTWGDVEHGRTSFNELSASNTTGDTTHIRVGGSPNFDVFNDGGTFGIYGGNLGDVLVTFTNSAALANEFENGVAISSPLNAGFDNPFTPDGSAITTVDRWPDTGGYLVSMFHVTSGAETNVHSGAGYFPYAEGWLGGVFRNASNNSPLADAESSFAPGVSLADGTVIRQEAGITVVDLQTLTSGGVPASSSNGVLLACGGKNENNVASYASNPDGTFSVFNRDTTFPAGTEDDGIAFVFLPLGAVATAMADGLLPFGRFDANGSRILGQGLISAVRDGANDRWTIAVTGQTPGTGTLLVAKDEDDSDAGNNFVTARPSGSNWIVEHWDTSAGVSVEGEITGPAFSAAFLPDVGTIAVAGEPVPTLTEWGIIVLILGLALLAARRAGYAPAAA